MLQDFFGDFLRGRLTRQRFIVLWPVLMFGHALVTLPLMRLTDEIRHRFTNGEVSSNSGTIVHIVVLMLVVAVVVLTLTALFAAINVISKRARDIGLLALLPACTFVVIVGARSVYGSNPYIPAIGLILVLLLAAVPTDAMRSST